MAKIFSDSWMQEFAYLWNDDKEMIEKLSAANFTSNIGFGRKGDNTPAGIVEVKNGAIIYAGEFKSQTLDWDLRADMDAWKEWLIDGFGFNKLGVAVSTGKLQFLTGDYRQMIRNPNMAGPFLRHFELMAKLDTEFA